ncbi:MAG TPA: type VI secretion system-associated FHA domain protein [Polyangiaceae bacterium]
MNKAYILRAYLFDGTLIHERRFAALPIRIGRNALNDFSINQMLVSGFHAMLEPADTKVLVRDLGSKNGVLIRHMKTGGAVRVETHAAVDLAALGFEFFLGPQVQVRVQVVAGDAEEQRPPTASDGVVLGNAQMLKAPGFEPSPLPPHRVPLAAPAHRPTIEPPAVPEGGPGYPIPAPRGSYEPPPLGPAGGRASGPSLPPESRMTSARGERSVPLATGHFGSLALETLALQGLHELAASLVPDKTLQTSGDLARFITKLHDSIEVFCRCFIPLREGYAQFVSSLDLQRAANLRSSNRSRAYQTVEAARDPEQLAKGLLDWTDRSLDGHQAVENIYADLMIHQVALLDGVMQGVRALLDELSPAAVEENVGHKFGISNRYKELWQAYCDLYEDLAQEQQAFARIFGHEFTEAYREYRSKKQLNDLG